MGLPDVLLQVGHYISVIGVLAALIHGALTLALAVKNAPKTAVLYAKRTFAIAAVTFVAAFAPCAVGASLAGSVEGLAPADKDAIVARAAATTISTAVSTFALLLLPTAVAGFVFVRHRRAASPG